ncbi:MAG: hypothetical protein NTX57_19335 [Armatimonadetes bacterium]|nr:hypothetical protein [Armatimonadota bacterium]
MTPEDALLSYLYPRLVDALQSWKGFDDIYGIWIVLALFEDEPTKPSFSHVMPLRHSVATPERINSYFGYTHSPGVADYTVSASLELCADPWPSPEYTSYYEDVERDEGDPDGLSLREAFFSWKRKQPGYLNPLEHPELRDLDLQELNWFLEICGKLIHRLHAEGVLTTNFGKAIPVGISFCNDIDERITIPATQNNNPPGLADGMLTWMRSDY